MEIEIGEEASTRPRPDLRFRDGWPCARGLLDEAGFRRALDARLAASLEKGVVRVARAGGEALGLVALRESPWDAEGLGVPAVGTVDVVALSPLLKENRGEVLERLASALDAFSRERKTTLDWLRADAGDVAWQDALIGRGFRAVELLYSLVSPEKSLERPAPAWHGTLLRHVREDDVSWLRSLAASAFRESRFGDPEGPEGWNARVYARWIDARFSQQNEKLLFLIAEHSGKRAGFVIWKIHETPGTPGLTGQVDLVAVSPEARGKGVGRALLDEARRLSPALEWVAADVYARNPLGLALHRRYGLRVAAASTYLHRWRRP